MRYHAARTRITQDPSAAHRQAPLFALRPDIQLTAGHYRQTSDQLLRTVLLLWLLLCLVWLFKPTTGVLLLGYLPVWAMFCRRFWRGLNLPGTFTGVVGGVGLYVVALLNYLGSNEVALPALPSWAWLLGGYFLFFAFLIGIFSGSQETTIQEAFPATGFVSLALVIALAGYLEGASPMLVARGLLLCALCTTLFAGLQLVRCYAGWLACSPRIPYASAARLMCISRCKWSELPSYFPPDCRRRTYWIVLAPLALIGVSLWLPEYAAVRLAATHVVQSTALSPLAHAIVWLAAAAGLVVWERILSGLGGNQYSKRTRSAVWWPLIIFKPIAVWETDNHPTPYAPGVYSPAQTDVLGLPIRRFLTTASVVPVLLAFLATRPGGGQAPHSLAEGLVLVYLLHAGMVVVCVWVVTLIGLGVLISPLLSFVEALGDGKP